MSSTTTTKSAVRHCRQPRSPRTDSREPAGYSTARTAGEDLHDNTSPHAVRCDWSQPRPTGPCAVKQHITARMHASPTVAWWRNGRASDFRPRGHGFDPRLPRRRQSSLLCGVVKPRVPLPLPFTNVIQSSSDYSAGLVPSPTPT